MANPAVPQDACHIYLAGPIHDEYGPPMWRVLGNLGSLDQMFFAARNDGRMMNVTTYTTSSKDGSIESTAPILINPDHIESIAYASKSDRRAAGWDELDA